jgi:hypothetical protein
VLYRVLEELESTDGPLDLNELSRRLDIDRSALDGMIQFWVRKGRLIDDAAASNLVCAPGHCGGSCPGPKGCPFTMDMPQTYTLKAMRDT